MTPSEHLKRPETELGGTLADTAGARTPLEQQLAHANRALQQHAEQRAAAERAAVAREAATRQAELEERLAGEEARCRALEQTLATAESAHRQAEQRSRSELAAAAARLADSQAQHHTAMARAARVCKALEQKLLELEAALRHTQQQRASEAAASVDHLAQRHADFTASLTQAARARDALAQQLSAAMAALDETRQKRTAEAAAAAGHLARREAELGAMLAEAVAARTELDKKLADTNAALERAEQRATVERAAAAQTAAQREAELEAAAAQREAELEGRLAQREAELEGRLAQREAELEGRLAQEVTERKTLEQQLEDAQAAQQDADRRHASELAMAAAHLADAQAQFDATAAQVTRERDALVVQLEAAAAALEDSRQQRAADEAAAAERLAQREAEIGATLAESVASRTALEHALEEAKAASQEAQERAGGDLAAAAERQAELEVRLAQEAGTRTTLERDLAETRMDTARARRRFLEVGSAIRRRTREQRERLEAQLSRERADQERALAGSEEKLRHVELERETLQLSLRAAQEELQRQLDAHKDERQEYERARMTSESELQRLSAEYDQVQHSLDQVRAAFQSLELVSSDHAIERARLEGVVAERDAQLSAQAAAHLAAEQAAEDAIAQVQERLRLALEASSQETAQHQQDVDALRQELEVSRIHVEALQRDADRVPVLQKQLDESLEENRRQFERAPYGLCRCNADGVITHVNPSFVSLLGCRTADDLLDVDLATVFESPADLRWLIERSATTGTPELVETTWRKKDRRHLVVRLQILATPNEAVEIIAQDVTHVRAVEERLRQARRMEAVGRLASEVAVTCDNLLRDVTQDGQQWLAAIESDTALRQQGELLLAEVARAAGFLRQFAVYGNKQMRALEPVNVPRVLHDLEPVLKRVAGEDIDLVVPKTSADVDFDVDVDAERVERVLVNVASYARQRMPHGGRVQIDLGTAVVDRGFIDKYPNVRPGDHVLITVTEVRSTTSSAGSDLPPELRGEPDAAHDGESTSDKPGVDLGVLLGLVGDCGGHLWMAAEPAGNMTLKIHLPKRAADEESDRSAAITQPDHGHSVANWFRR